MINYNEMTDFELSCLVTDKHNKSNIHRGRGNKPLIFNDAFCRDNKHKFDINDWGDMGPLIDDTWDELMFVSNDFYETKWSELVDKYNCSKLRAAAICYLEMK